MKLEIVGMRRGSRPGCPHLAIGTETPEEKALVEALEDQCPSWNVRPREASNRAWLYLPLHQKPPA